MKAWSGFVELIIIMVFMMASVPLIIIVSLTCSKSRFNYLEDKTVYASSNTAEMYYSAYDNKYYPMYMLPMYTNYGGAQLIAFCQDEYCPEEARGISWALLEEDLGCTLRNMDTADELANEQFRIDVTSGWYGLRRDKFSDAQKVLSQGTWARLFDNKFYLVYNFEEDRWMITTRDVSVFQQRVIPAGT